MWRSALLLMALTTACGNARDAGERVAEATSRFTSQESTLYDFEFDGVIAADARDAAVVKGLIGAQLMYTVGALNGETSVGRVASAAISNIEMVTEGTFRYHAKLPVAWGAPELPTSYVLTFPRRAARADQSAFAAKYGATCADAEAGPPPVHPSIMFLHFRPQLPSCVLAPEDVVTVTANVERSADNRQGKYPEYDLVWEDKTLNVVALFGRDGAVGTPDESDEGARAYARFVTDLRAYLDVADSGMPIVKELPDGRTVRVDARMVEHAIDVTPGIDDWYAARTMEADLILYNGHADLGGNVRSLIRKGRFRSRKYAVLALNACDTFAYLDDLIVQRQRALNPDDPAGTKYVDVISNVMPGYFGNGPSMSLTLIRAFIDPPVTYDEILSRLDPAQVASVTGEEDNSFVPAQPVKSSQVRDGGRENQRPAVPVAADAEEDADVKTAPSSCSAAPGPRSSGGGALLALLVLSCCARRGARGRSGGGAGSLVRVGETNRDDDHVVAR